MHSGGVSRRVHLCKRSKHAELTDSDPRRSLARPWGVQVLMRMHSGCCWFLLPVWVLGLWDRQDGLTRLAVHGVERDPHLGKVYRVLCDGTRLTDQDGHSPCAMDDGESRLYAVRS
jgi:hypothetical protein